MYLQEQVAIYMYDLHVHVHVYTCTGHSAQASQNEVGMLATSGV